MLSGEIQYDLARPSGNQVGENKQRCENRIPLTPPIQPCFTLPHVWSGGHYELELCLGAPSDENILAALRALWQPPDLEGPYADRDKEPRDQRLIEDLAELDHLFGIARFRGVRVPCATFVRRNEDDQGRRLRDFLSMCFPLGALSLVFRVGAYPFADWDAAPGWRAEVDAWFVQFLTSRRQSLTFEFGLIGFELNALTEDLVQGYKAGTIPSERDDGVVFNRGGTVTWRPPNLHA